MVRSKSDTVTLDLTDSNVKLFKYSYLKEFVEVSQRVRFWNWASISKLHVHGAFRPSYHDFSFVIDRVPANRL